MEQLLRGQSCWILEMSFHTMRMHTWCRALARRRMREFGNQVSREHPPFEKPPSSLPALDGMWHRAAEKNEARRPQPQPAADHAARVSESRAWPCARRASQN